MKQEFTKNSEGTRLGLHRIPAAGNAIGTVILSHGTFSNYRSCRGLARHLAGCGFDCWLLDFQGHGVSGTPVKEPDFESMCLLDTAAALEYVADSGGDKKFWWVGHSGGGLAILMFLARNLEKQERIHGVVTLASQATDAAKPVSNRVLIHLARAITSLLGVAPGKYLGLGPENEFAAVMQQWFGWSLAGQWCGKDGFDYLHGLARLDLPVLSLAASADHFIAPPVGCERIHQHLGGSDKTFRVCGLQSGDKEDYTHARIVSSRSASEDVWPLIADWLSHRQT